MVQISNSQTVISYESQRPVGSPGPIKCIEGKAVEPSIMIDVNLSLAVRRRLSAIEGDGSCLQPLSIRPFTIAFAEHLPQLRIDLRAERLTSDRC